MTAQRLELFAVVLVATGTIATAWSAYQVALPRGVQARVRGWLADPDAAETPFALPQYRTAATAEAERLEATAAAASERAKDANERAGGYMLAVVLFATALFFAGVSTRLETRAIRLVTLGIGCAVPIAILVWTATFPVELTPIG